MGHGLLHQLPRARRPIVRIRVPEGGRPIPFRGTRAGGLVPVQADREHKR